MATIAQRARALAELVRLPAVLTVPGDALTGAALAGGPLDPGRAAGIGGASAALYLGGMALNDWADREVDARERPGRPIPSGRVSPRLALGVAAGLTGLGLTLAGGSGGRRGLATAAATAAAAWAYDLAAKSTPVGPATMAAARGLDVLLGAAGREGARRALPGAGVVALHTLVVTRLSAHEVAGGGPRAGAQALLGTAAVVGSAGLLALRRAPSRGALAQALALLAAYGITVGEAQAAARDRPDPPTTRKAVGAGILGLVLLESALLAAAGRPLPSAALATLHPVARTLARRRPVT